MEGCYYPTRELAPDFHHPTTGERNPKPHTSRSDVRMHLHIYKILASISIDNNMQHKSSEWQWGSSYTYTPTHLKMKLKGLGRQKKKPSWIFKIWLHIREGPNLEVAGKGEKGEQQSRNSGFADNVEMVGTSISRSIKQCVLTDAFLNSLCFKSTPKLSRIAHKKIFSIFLCCVNLHFNIIFFLRQLD